MMPSSDCKLGKVLVLDCKERIKKFKSTAKKSDVNLHNVVQSPTTTMAGFPKVVTSRENQTNFKDSPFRDLKQEFQ